MDIRLHDLSIRLDRHTAFRLGRARGLTVTSVDGFAWLTVDGDRRDVILAPAESFTVGSDRPVVVTAFDAAATIALRAPAASASTFARAVAALASGVSTAARRIAVAIANELGREPRAHPCGEIFAPVATGGATRSGRAATEVAHAAAEVARVASGVAHAAAGVAHAAAGAARRASGEPRAAAGGA